MSEGGKTGITAIVIGIMFFISIFFAPIFASIPGWATGGALIIVGSLMIRKWVFPSFIRIWWQYSKTLLFSVREINWDYIGDAVPAFVTLIIIPLSYKWVWVFFSLERTGADLYSSYQHRVRSDCRFSHLHLHQLHSLGPPQIEQRPNSPSQLWSVRRMDCSTW